MEIIKNYFGKAKLVLMVASFALLSVLPITNVSAISDYDGLIQVPTELKLSYPGYTDIDMTNKFMDYVLGNITSGVGYNDCSTDCKAVINDSLQNGDWAVTQVYSNYPGDQYMVDLTFCNGKMNSTSFSYNYLGSMRTDGLSGSSNTPVDCAVITIKYQPTTDANHIFIVSNIFQNQTNGVMTVSVRVKYASGVIPYYAQPYIYTASNTINYPSGYEGTVLADNETDGDGDGLDVVQETMINTSDAKIDTDGDGLDDFTESPWNPNRDAVFCNTSTPKNCAYPNPMKKDVYVEVDWMDDGTTSYKPTTAQLEPVKDAFDAKNIAVHFDTGQYGGGDELPVYISPLKVAPDVDDTDYFNLKNGDNTYTANFSENRRGIWRYMVATNKHFANGTADSTGAAYPGDDDIVVSIGRVKELNSTNVDTAVAGTIMHELGHSLCLTNTPYTWMDSACFYTGVDSSAGNNYVSSMNYDKQFSLIDYSLGLNNTGDHDDWSGVLVGMDDFVTLGADPTEGLNRGGTIFDKPLLSGRD